MKVDFSYPGVKMAAAHVVSIFSYSFHTNVLIFNDVTLQINVFNTVAWRERTK